MSSSKKAKQHRDPLTECTECGYGLPVHLLFENDKDNLKFTHVCRCEARYRATEAGEFYRDGSEHNPVAAYDNAHPQAPEKHRKWSKSQLSCFEELGEELKKKGREAGNTYAALVRAGMVRRKSGEYDSEKDEFKWYIEDLYALTAAGILEKKRLEGAGLIRRSK